MLFLPRPKHHADRLRRRLPDDIPAQAAAAVVPRFPGVSLGLVLLLILLLQVVDELVITVRLLLELFGVLLHCLHDARLFLLLRTPPALLDKGDDGPATGMALIHEHVV